MLKRYLRACINLAGTHPEWLREALENPSPSMRPIHIKIGKLALARVRTMK